VKEIAFYTAISWNNLLLMGARFFSSLKYHSTTQILENSLVSGTGIAHEEAGNDIA
jgi:hypothetical protein